MASAFHFGIVRTIGMQRSILITTALDVRAREVACLRTGVRIPEQVDQAFRFHVGHSDLKSAIPEGAGVARSPGRCSDRAIAVAARSTRPLLDPRSLPEPPEHQLCT